MATRNLSAYNPEFLPEASGMSFAVIVSDWNDNVTGKLLEGAVDCLIENKVDEGNIHVYHVPGSFELVYAAAHLMDLNEATMFPLDGIIVLGCVVRGGTPHFDYVCQGVTQGISALNAKGAVPVIFGLLTTDNMEQATDRAGGKLGNKGVEAAVTAIRMAGLKSAMNREYAAD